MLFACCLYVVQAIFAECVYLCSVGEAPTQNICQKLQCSVLNSVSSVCVLEHTDLVTGHTIVVLRR